jgi:ferredoxin
MSYRLRVNPVSCEAHGICAELFPERITLDPWGYPIIAPQPVPDELLGHARRAVAGCPTLALLIDRAD